MRLRKQSITIILISFLIPHLVFASISANTGSTEKTLSGTVTTISGNRLIFKTSSAATYDAETSTTTFVRRNGSAMQFTDIIVGDKIQVFGKVWSDNSMNASYIRNMSLYAHNSTFNGKVTWINPTNSSFTMESKKYGVQTIHTNTLTAFKRGGSSATFQDLELQVTASVKGTWDRSYANVQASSVQVTSRLLNIEFTGAVVLKESTGLTVLANNVMYGVNVTKAKFQNKNGKPISLANIPAGSTVKVTGKHISESPRITASKVKVISTPN